MPAFTIDSPEVQALLAGVLRSSAQSYFKISPDNRCYTYPIRRHLMSLGLNQKAATLLIQQAEIPFAEYVRNTPPKAIPKAKPPSDDARRLREIKEEARRLRAAREAEKLLSRRYQLVETRTGKVGILDENSGSQTLFLTLEDVLAYRQDLIDSKQTRRVNYASTGQRQCRSEMDSEVNHYYDSPEDEVDIEELSEEEVLCD